MKRLTWRRAGVALAVGLVVMVAGFFGVMQTGAFAASAPTVTVTCTLVNYRGNDTAAAVVSWSNASGLGFIDIATGGINDVRLTTSQRSGTFVVYAAAGGPSVFAQASLYSKPDKSGNVTFLAGGNTPAGDCDY